MIGRHLEQDIIDNLLKSKKAEFLVVYGRRRVGKTFLVRRVCENQIVFDFTGSYNVKHRDQLTNFFHVYLERTQGVKETTVPISWPEAFRYLKDYLLTHSKKKKIVVFLDELPWMDTARSGFVTALEFFWNQYGSKMNNLLLIGCGSAASWIHKKIIKAKGGLHNRVTKRIHLHPFNLKETEEYCVANRLNFTRYQIIQLYMVMGGVPFYLDELKKGSSAVQCIDQICFKRSGLLYTEFEYLFESLFDDAQHHMAIVKALASKPNGLIREELLSISGVPEGGSAQRTLEELDLSGFITRRFPFSNKKKESLYKLSDYYSLFYCKFILAAKNAKKGSWQAISNTTSFRAWSGYAFENICFQHVDNLKWALGIGGVLTEVSAWKFKGNDESPGAQIDLVIDRKDDVVNLCEAKFTDKEFLLTKSYVQKLRTKKAVFKYATGTRKSLHTTLITTYSPIENKYFKSEIDSAISMDTLFV